MRVSRPGGIVVDAFVVQLHFRNSSEVRQIRLLVYTKICKFGKMGSFRPVESSF